jgi:hypothetical protein
VIQVQTRDGIFGAGGYGGGVFDGTTMGFGGMGAYEQAAAGVRGLGATSDFVWCSKTSPCAVGDPRVKALQIAVNVVLKAHGYQQIATDGKLGAATCGALTWLGALPQDDPTAAAFDAHVNTDDLNGVFGACQTVTYPTKVGSAIPVTPNQALKEESGITGQAPVVGLPWGTQDPRTTTLQTNINADLVGHDYYPLTVSGALDAPTCGAMRLATASWGMDYLSVYGGDCQAFTAPSLKPAAVVAPPTPVHHDDVVPPTPLPQKASMGGWVVGGLLVAAVAAGIVASRKKR